MSWADRRLRKRWYPKIDRATDTQSHEPLDSDAHLGWPFILLLNPPVGGGTVPKSGFDTGAGADVHLKVAQALSDLGVGAETSALFAALALVEAGVGADVVVKITLALAEVGTGADAFSLFATLVGAAETGTGADAVVKVALSLADVAAGVDASFLAALITAAEVGVGVDTALLYVLPFLLSASEEGFGEDELWTVIEHTVNSVSIIKGIENQGLTGGKGRLPRLRGVQGQPGLSAAGAKQKRRSGGLEE